MRGNSNAGSLRERERKKTWHNGKMIQKVEKVDEEQGEEQGREVVCICNYIIIIIPNKTKVYKI